MSSAMFKFLFLSILIGGIVIYQYIIFLVFAPTSLEIGLFGSFMIGNIVIGLMMALCRDMLTQISGINGDTKEEVLLLLAATIFFPITLVLIIVAVIICGFIAGWNYIDELSKKEPKIQADY